MSAPTHFPLFSSIARRIGEKFSSTKRYVVEFLTVDDFNTDLDRKPDNVRYFYVKIRYYSLDGSSRFTNEIIKEFKTRRGVNDCITYYQSQFHIKSIIRGVVLK